MDIIGRDLAAGILFTLQSLILVEFGLRLGVKSAFVLCFFHKLFVREKANENRVTPLLHGHYEAKFFMWSFFVRNQFIFGSFFISHIYRTSPVPFCKIIRITADW